MLARLLRIPVKLARSIAIRYRDDALVVHWPIRHLVGRNWGDKLNPVLCRMISGMNVVRAYDIFPVADRPAHFVIGSSLQRAQKRRGIVWGAGFIDAGQGLRQEPRRICAVRGQHSRERLRELGISSPEVVGDPAILMPRLYRPRILNRRWRAGVIAHCYELDLASVDGASLPDDVLAIDITANLFDVIDQVCACDEIFSSSLHGLICAEAYGVPSRWVRLSDRPAGDGFKFRDFYTSIDKSVGAENHRPADVERAADWPKLLGSAPTPVARDVLAARAEALYRACPFTPDSRRGGSD